MANDLSPMLQAAYDILKDAGRRGMHVKSIAEAAVAQHKNLGLSVEDFQKKVSAALTNNLKLKNCTPTFAKVNWEKKDGKAKQGKPRQGWYRLRQEKIVQAGSNVQAPKAGNSFIGCAGEYAVMGELLFWGYNVATMAVDDGVDIVASKDSRFFHIQVKTATCRNDGKYTFTIRQDSFQRYDALNMFYVLVLRGKASNEYVILPSLALKLYIGEGTISDSSAYTLTLSSDSRKSKFVLNGKADITQFYGRFDNIK